MNKHMMMVIIMLLSMMVPLTASSHSNFSSINYTGVDDVIDSGGGFTTSTNYDELSAIGQSGQGTVISGNYILHAGFLHPIPPSPALTVTPTATPFVTAIPTLTATISATLTITATSSITATQTITPTGQIWDGDDIIFYPNPGMIGKSCWFQVKINSDEAKEVTVKVYNTVGELVVDLQETCSSGINQLAFDSGNLSPGIYFFKVKIGDKEEGFKKLVLVK